MAPNLQLLVIFQSQDVETRYQLVMNVYLPFTCCNSNIKVVQNLYDNSDFSQRF